MEEKKLKPGQAVYITGGKAMRVMKAKKKCKCKVPTMITAGECVACGGQVYSTTIPKPKPEGKEENCCECQSRGQMCKYCVDKMCYIATENMKAKIIAEIEKLLEEGGRARFSFGNPKLRRRARLLSPMAETIIKLIESIQ